MSASLSGRSSAPLHPAARSPVADGASLVLEVRTLGNDDAARVTHVFADKTVELSFEAAGGFRAKVEDGPMTETDPFARN